MTIISAVKEVEDVVGRTKWEAISFVYGCEDTVDTIWAEIATYAAAVRFGPEQTLYLTSSKAAI